MDDKIDRIFITHKDRLTRFGFNYLTLICNQHQTKVVILSNEMNNKSMEEELAEDIIAIIHSFSGKLYGMRSKVQKEVEKELKDG